MQETIKFISPNDDTLNKRIEELKKLEDDIYDSLKIPKEAFESTIYGEIYYRFKIEQQNEKD